MARAMLERAAAALTTALGASLLVAALLHLVPGDPVDAMLGEHAAAADRDAMRSALGLDRSVEEQVLGMLLGFLRGDLGRSLITGEPVAARILDRYPATLQLAGAALLLAVALALPLGAAAALRPRSFADRAAKGLATLTASLPTFALGPILLLVFAVELPWLPVGGRQGLESVVLPALTLALGMSAVLARHLQTSLARALRDDWARAARARGASPARVFFVHGLPNAATASVEVLALQTGGLLAGAVVTETVFAWPGLGRLLVDAIGARDYPTVQGCSLVIALTFVAVGFVTDSMQAWLDPRVRR